MSRDELLKTLQTLHHELTRATDLDDETRRMLQVVTDDIQLRLNRSEDEVSAGDETTGEPSVADRLRDTVAEFETQHPQLAKIVERLTEGLANLGI